jgi:hypothetical protein
MMRSKGNMSLKNPVTPPGIDLGTVRLLAQRLNHYATPGPTKECSYYIYQGLTPKNKFLKMCQDPFWHSHRTLDET